MKTIGEKVIAKLRETTTVRVWQTFNDKLDVKFVGSIDNNYLFDFRNKETNEIKRFKDNENFEKLKEWCGD